MIRATNVVRRGHWSGEPADRIELDFDQRHRRRIAMQGEGGLGFLLDLPEAVALRDGDGLVLDDGRIVAVAAKPEALLDVRADDPHHLARIAWHLGNRHVAAAIGTERILIRPDHVLVTMLKGLGARIRDVEEAFDPEAGAYAGDHGEGDGHGHAHHREHGDGNDHRYQRHG